MDAEALLERTPKRPVHEPADRGNVGQTLQADLGAGGDAQRRDRGGTEETSAAAHNGGLSGNSAVQQPDQRPGGRDRAARDRIQHDRVEQPQKLEEPVDENSAGFSFSGEITQEDIDSALLAGSHVVGGKFRIYQQFAKQESNADSRRH